MYCTRTLTDSVSWVGGTDRRLALFENLFPIPRGITYNSYLILDEKTALIDTVDSSITLQFLENIQFVLNNRPLDYLVINHMEPEDVYKRQPPWSFTSTSTWTWVGHPVSGRIHLTLCALFRLCLLYTSRCV